MLGTSDRVVFKVKTSSLFGVMGKVLARRRFLFILCTSIGSMLSFLHYFPNIGHSDEQDKAKVRFN